MPHKPSQYEFDTCPDCGSKTGTPYLRRWTRERQLSKSITIYDEKHNPVAVETTFKEKYDINRTRSKMGLPGLDAHGLIEINKINEQVSKSILDIACHWDALSTIFPYILQKYPKMFEIFDIPRITYVYCKMFNPFIDRRFGSADWSTWFDISYWASVQSYRAAAQKTAVKKWSGRMHRVSVKQIKNKLPEVREFAKDVVEYLPKFSDFRIAVFETFIIDFEIRKLFIDCYQWLRNDTLYIQPRAHNVYQYYYIHHPLRDRKGRRTCGPFKKSEIPGLRPAGVSESLTEFDNITEGMNDVRDCFVKLANSYRENPAARTEDAIKYCEVIKNVFF